MAKYERSKRPSHTGSITTLIPGKKYRVRVSGGFDSAGKRIVHTKTVWGTKAEAERVCSEMQLSLGANSPRPVIGTVTVKEVLDLWQSAHRSVWTPANVRNTRAIVDSPLSMLHQAQVDRLTASKIRGHYNFLKQLKGLSDGYIGRIHSTLRSALAWALSEGLTTVNPAADVRRMAKKARPKPVPMIDGVKAMMAASEPWVATFLEFALATGARRGELAGLQWGDIEAVDEAYCRVTFERRVSDRDVVDGLKASDRKTVIVSAALVERLRRVTRSDVWVFGNGPSHVSPGTLSRHFRKARAKVIDRHPELEGTTLHGLRHLSGSHMLENGATIPQVSAHLGHASPAITLSVYSHYLKQDDTTAANLFAAL